MRQVGERKEAYWRSVLRRQQKSGMSIQKFCTENQLTEGTFYSWKKRIANRDREDASPKTNSRKRAQVKRSTKQRDETSVFIPVRLGAAAGGVLEVVHPRGHVVRVPAAFDENSLGKIFRLLDQQGET